MSHSTTSLPAASALPAYAKPLPPINDASRPFWEALRQRRLQLPRCDGCGSLRTFFEPGCPSCGGTAFGWQELSGQGVVWSYCRFHKVYIPAFAAEAPYNVTLVQLAEGPLLVTQLVDAAERPPAVGQPVQAVFEDVTDDVTLLKFRRAD